MPNSNPRDRFVYPIHKLMIDSYIIFSCMLMPFISTVAKNRCVIVIFCYLSNVGSIEIKIKYFLCQITHICSRISPLTLTFERVCMLHVINISKFVIPLA